MGPKMAELVAGIIDRIKDRPPGPGRPPVPTVEVVETLRFFLRMEVQWRELRTADGRTSGSTLRRRLDEWHSAAIASIVKLAAAERGVVTGELGVSAWQAVLLVWPVRRRRRAWNGLSPRDSVPRTATSRIPCVSSMRG